MKKKIKKEFREISIVASIFLLLYFTGLHTEVAAFAQRVILTTGLITADTDSDPTTYEDVDYNFKLKNLNGEFTDLSEYKGKVVFINIWATWCPPCVAEMPNIQSLYDKIENDNIEFIMLSMDNSEEKAKKFIDKKGFVPIVSVVIFNCGRTLTFEWRHGGTFRSSSRSIFYTIAVRFDEYYLILDIFHSLSLST